MSAVGYKYIDHGPGCGPECRLPAQSTSASPSRESPSTGSCPAQGSTTLPRRRRQPSPHSPTFLTWLPINDGRRCCHPRSVLFALDPCSKLSRQLRKVDLPPPCLIG